MKTILLAVAASALALAACGEKAADTSDSVALPADETANTGMTADGKATMNGMGDTATGTTGSSISASSDPKEYVTQAASGDQYEIQSSQMVLAKSKNPAVRQFAQMMIDDHRASTKKLLAAATGAALPAPGTTLLAAHEAKLTDLREAGTDLDEKYVEQQREAHAEAIALHETMTGNSAAPAQLASFAGEVLPKVREHARMLDTMKVGTTANN